MLSAYELTLWQNTWFDNRVYTSPCAISDAGVPSLGREHHGLWIILSLMGRLATFWLLPQRLVVRVAPAFRVISGPRLRVCFSGRVCRDTDPKVSTPMWYGHGTLIGE